MKHTIQVCRDDGDLGEVILLTRQGRNTARLQPPIQGSVIVIVNATPFGIFSSAHMLVHQAVILYLIVPMTSFVERKNTASRY